MYVEVVEEEKRVKKPNVIPKNGQQNKKRCSEENVIL
jgi:hypothetical protein